MSSKSVVNDEANSILILAHLMHTCTEFKPDLSKMAELLGIAQAKNVPRKINNILNPHGFELRTGKIVEKEDNVAPPATPTKANNSHAAKASKSPTPNANGGKAKDTDKSSPAKKSRASKKRVAEAAGESDNDDGGKESPKKKAATKRRKASVVADTNASENLIKVKNNDSGNDVEETAEDNDAAGAEDDAVADKLESVED